MQGGALGPYRIDAELGAGGMGKVYRATTTRKTAGLEAGATVALKVVHAHLIETEGFFKRFLREGEIGKSVRHENVVRTFDCDALGGQMYLVMEYVEGQTLRALLAELDRVPEELCRHIGREVAKGLAAIHAAGVVHRDMKPENVLITKEHVVKVMDLGVARLNDEALRLSQTGAFVGSIHYAAPESFSDGGRNVDGRADLHALGLVLYELACGINPYFADDVPQILKRVLHEAPRRLGDLNPQLSPFFEEVVHCLLAKKPGDRFADAATLLDVLEEGEKSDWWTARAKAIRAVTHQPLRRIRIPRETAVYGRENEIAKLRALFGKSKAGEGQVVVVEGEAGIGKSRVVDELIGRLQRDGEELNFLFGSYPPGGAATAAGAFSTAFREQFGADGSAAYLTPSPVLVPAFDALLRGETTPSGVEPLTKDSLQTCFVHAMRGLAAERTTVLLIDDLHFATEDARSLFTSLAMAAPGHRVLLVGTTRPGIDERWLAGLTRLPQTSQLGLHRLGPKDLAQLLADSLRSESLATQLGHQIAVKSDGNPFFVFEIIRGLRDGQFLTQKDDGTWVSTRVIGDIQIPSSILDLVNARVADLTEDERALLDVAACWGFEFDAGLVGEVLGHARIPTLRSFGQIERRHRLVRSSGRNYVFDHHQVQEALYGSINEQLREEYHAALANALEAREKCADKDSATLDGALCVDLCEHFLKGAQGERARRYLDAALTHLEKGWLNDAAIRLADRALDVPELVTGRARCELLLRKAGRLDVLARAADERRAIDEAVALAEECGDAKLRAHARHMLGWHLSRASRYADAETEIVAAIELARESGDTSRELRASASLASVLHVLGRPEEAAATYERRRGLARSVGDPLLVAAAAADGAFSAQGAVDEVLARHERLVQVAREVGDRRTETIGTMNLGVVMRTAGRFEDARVQYEASLAMARALGERRLEASVIGMLGGAFWGMGRYADELTHTERHIALAREVGDRTGESLRLNDLGELRRRLGDPDAARRSCHEGLALARTIRYPRGEASANVRLAMLEHDAGDDAAALALVESALAIDRKIDNRRGAAGALLLLGSVHLAVGDATAARVSLTEAADIARTMQLPGTRTLASCRSALLPGADPTPACALLAEIESRLACDERMEAHFLLWQSTHDPVHLAEAKRLLDFLVAHAPPDCRGPMLAIVRLHREIAAAAKVDGTN